MAAGRDLTMAAVGVALHRCLEAADQLGKDGIEATVIDLRTVAPLDVRTVAESVATTGRLLVADEDYRSFALSGVLAAAVLEAGAPALLARVCVKDTMSAAKRSRSPP